MGLVILGAIALYLLVSIAVVFGAIRYARKRGKSAARWGVGVALVMYLLVFWDHIPTVLMHKYYCEKEAGFWVYKTPEQWMKENPGVMETLVDNSPNRKYPNWPETTLGEKKIESVNQRVGIYRRDHLRNADEGELFVNVWRWQAEILDTMSLEVLARQVDFSSGNGYIGGPPPLKFWLQNPGCHGAVDDSNRFEEFLEQIRGASK